MDSGNKKTIALDSGSKRSKPPKRNKIGAYDDSDATGLINNSFEMEMDCMDDEKKNNRNSAANRLKKALNKNMKPKNPILFISNVMQNAQRWKSYATSRRKLKTSGADEGCDRRKTGGDGLTYEMENDPQSKDNVDGTDASKVDKEMKNIHNRNLIEYFARMAQSKNEDECVNLDYILSVLNNGADINCTDKYKQTVLHEAARAWEVDVARFLVECGASLDQGDYHGRTPLHVAAAVDYPEMVHYLIEAGANKEAKTLGELQTPVHFAARNDARNSLKALLKSGCEYKEVKDYKGRTPLHVAAELDRSETARMLLEIDDPAPAGVIDNSGQAAIVWMITKMPPVAKLALDQFHTTDRANRKQFYHLNWLEPKNQDDSEKATVFPQTAVQVAVAYQRYDVITHPVFKRLFRTKWKQFARWKAIFQTVTNFLFIVLWTAQGVTVDYNDKHRYELPGQWWRILLYVFAILMAIWQIREELSEYFHSRKSHSQWKDWRESEITRDLQFVHNRWPEEEQYLNQEIEELDNIRPQYFNDFWNIFDWICYALLLVCIITHLVDVGYHTNFIARLHIRLMAITIILIWLRLLKNARAFSLLGPFIVIVGHMIRDVFKFGFLYLAFFIPYCCAFWMLFGGQKIPEKYQGHPWAANYTTTVGGMARPNNLIFSLFRITLVDDYAYDDMKAVDDIMADLLVGTWLALSAIVMLNLFIALMSDTFQRVFDNANANAVMQKAITILSIEEGLSAKKRRKFRDFIHTKCAPEKEYYDDDATDATGADLQKVTIQIKEQLDDLSEAFRDAEKKRSRESFDSMDGDSEDDDDDDDDEEGRRRRRKGGPVSTHKFKEEIGKLQDDMSDVIEQQNLMAERFQKDMKKVMGLLKQIAVSSLSGQSLGSAPWPKTPSTSDQHTGNRLTIEVDGSVRTVDTPIDILHSLGRPPSGRRSYDPNLMIQRPAIMDLGQAQMGATFSSVNPVPRTPAVSLPASDHSTRDWVTNYHHTQPSSADTAWDDLEVKRRKDIKDLREQLAQQQKVASQQGKKLGRRRSRSVTSEDRRGRRKSGNMSDSNKQFEDNDSIITDSSVIPDVQTSDHNSEPRDPDA